VPGAALRGHQLCLSDHADKLPEAGLHGRDAACQRVGNVVDDFIGERIVVDNQFIQQPVEAIAATGLTDLDRVTPCIIGMAQGWGSHLTAVDEKGAFAGRLVITPDKVDPFIGWNSLRQRCIIAAVAEERLPVLQANQQPLAAGNGRGAQNGLIPAPVAGLHPAEHCKAIVTQPKLVCGCCRCDKGVVLDS